MAKSAGGKAVTEVERKYVVRREAAVSFLRRGGATAHAIDQVYLDAATAARHADALGLADAPAYSEWRIRRIEGRCYFCAKSAAGLQRREFEVPINEDRYAAMLAEAQRSGQVQRVRKTRHILPAQQGTLCAEIDDYHETGKGAQTLDFVTCEIEFPTEADAIRFQEACAPSEWGFLEGALDVTAHPALGNRALAREGFPAKDFDGLAAWLREQTRP